ncbi:MAG: DUF4133 domain-containing protein [Sphingobacteriales bacterium]|nr:MAG: DUF4133 domain-containing protein [Sphingobacteriales bacterium]
MNSVYHINKGINKQIEFKGLKAQYIAYLGIGLVALLLLFATLYLLGVHMYICLLLVGSLGSVLFAQVSRYSKKYGRYGLMKKVAQKRLPSAIIIRTRKVFTQLNTDHE